MERKAVFLAALFCWASIALGCASEESTTVCDDAVEKYKECKFEVAGSDNLNCSGSLECVSKCAVNATCDEMTNQKDPFQSCSNACGADGGK